MASEGVQRDDRQRAGFRVAAGAGALSLLTGLLVIAGWATGTTVLKSISPGMVAMNPLTAVGFICTGGALLLRLARYPGESLPGRSAGVAAALIGFLKIASFWGLDTGIDRWLFRTELDTGPLGIPNRMAPNTAIGFLLAGLALSLPRDRYRLAQALTLAGAAGPLLAAIGYLYGVVTLARVSYFIPMALNTSAAFLAVCTGIWALEPRRGLWGRICAEDAGGFLLRRLLPVVLVMPLAFGWLSLKGSESGFYDPRYGIALVALGCIAVLVALLFWTARALSRSSQQLQALNGELAEKLDELALANGDLQAFSYSVSHDLKAPLRSVSGFSELVLESEAPRLSDEGKDMLRRITRAAKRMGSLIDGLIELAGLARRELQMKNVSLSATALEIAAQLRETDAGRKVDFVIGEGLEARGDERMLHAVLQNLIGNAWKFTSKKDTGRIEVGRLEKNGQGVFFVKDNGAGFDMTRADSLFNPFQRLHSTSDYEGTGIGLATVRRIIERHGGKIWADAKPGEGATFFFCLG